MAIDIYVYITFQLTCMAKAELLNNLQKIYKLLYITTFETGASSLRNENIELVFTIESIEEGTR